MQADGKAWLYAPERAARRTAAGALRAARDRRCATRCTPSSRTRLARCFRATRISRARRHRSRAPTCIPYVVTTYRLTEHHTAGGMSRWSPYLAELQPEFFCEVSPELAAERGLEHLGWATIVTARTAIEARVLVTDRVTPLTVGGRTIHQIGLPYHWGVGGGGAIVSGDSANDVMGVALDPNVHIQESKAATCDIQPGRRPTGPALPRYVEEYRRRAGHQRRHRHNAGDASRGRRRDAAVVAPLADPAADTGWSEATGSQGVLHRQLHLHRLQGVRGRLQGVERHPRGRPADARHVVRQHRRSRCQHLAPRGLHRTAAPADVGEAASRRCRWLPPHLARTLLRTAARRRGSGG